MFSSIVVHALYASKALKIDGAAPGDERCSKIETEEKNSWLAG